MSVTFSSKERLELNVTSSFIELAITSYTQWTKESDRILKNVRGGDAPYLVRNRTGYPIEIWADGGKTARARSRIEDGAEMRWRFEDYKTLREVSRNIFLFSLPTELPSGVRLTLLRGSLPPFSTSANSARTLSVFTSRTRTGSSSGTYL